MARREKKSGETIGQRLKRYRDLARKTQREVAEAAGVSTPSLANWEQDQREPSIRHGVALAKALGCTVEQIIDGTISAERAKRVSRPRGRPVRQDISQDT